MGVREAHLGAGGMAGGRKQANGRAARAVRGRDGRTEADALSLVYVVFSAGFQLAW